MRKPAARPPGLLRATVTTNGLSGVPMVVQVDGGDSTIHVSGKPGYAPNAGDRILVTQVGTQVHMISLLSGVETIVAGVFETADDGTPRIRISNSTDPLFSQGGLIAFEVVGEGSGWNPGHIAANWLDSGGIQTGTVTILAPAPSTASIVAGLSLSHNTSGFSPTSIASLDARLVNIGASASGGIQLLSQTALTGDLLASGNGTFNLAVTAGQLFALAPGTSTNAADVRYAPGGQLLLVTSLSKFKLNQREVDLATASKALDVAFTSWQDVFDAAENGGTEGIVRTYGAVAEQVEKVAPEFAEYDVDGNLAGVDYRALSMALLPIVADLKHRIEVLERAAS